MVTSASSLTLSEIELNPPGSDNGNEWVELYSPIEIDGSDIHIETASGNKVLLSSYFSGYHKFVLQKQTLRNINESLSLYYKNVLLESSPSISDSENDARTWNNCSTWSLSNPSENTPNLCPAKKHKSEYYIDPYYYYPLILFFIFSIICLISLILSLRKPARKTLKATDILPLDG